MDNKNITVALNGNKSTISRDINYNPTTKTQLSESLESITIVLGEVDQFLRDNYVNKQVAVDLSDRVLQLQLSSTETDRLVMGYEFRIKRLEEIVYMLLDHISDGELASEIINFNSDEGKAKMAEAETFSRKTVFLARNS